MNEQQLLELLLQGSHLGPGGGPRPSPRPGRSFSPPPRRRPKLPPLDELFDMTGGLLRKTGDNVTGSAALHGIRSIGLYFGGRWCPHCPPFTEKLKMFYQQYKALDPQFEVIFISGDRSAADGNRYFRELHGNWLMMRFDSDAYKALSGHYDVEGIPSLVIVSKVGDIIMKNGRDIIRQPPAKVAAEGSLKKSICTGDRLVLSREGNENSQLRRIMPQGRVAKCVRLDEDGDPVIELPSNNPVAVAKDFLQLAPAPPVFKVGDSVRVKGSLRPWFGWGSARSGEMGIVKALRDKQMVTVEFPSNASWNADVYDLELVGQEPCPFVAGRRVRLQGLSASSGLNGALGTVEGPGANGRVQVDVDAFGVKAIQPKSIVLVLQVGCRVSAHDLTGAAELNGHHGKVVRDEGERLHVEFDGGVVKALREINLTLVKQEAQPKPPSVPEPKSKAEPAPKVVPKPTSNVLPEPKASSEQQPAQEPQPPLLSRINTPTDSDVSPDEDELGKWLVSHDFLKEDQVKAGIAVLHQEGIFSVEDAEDLESAQLREMLDFARSPKIPLHEWLESILDKKTLTTALEKCEEHGLMSVQDVKELGQTADSGWSADELTRALRTIFVTGVANRIKKSLVGLGSQSMSASIASAKSQNMEQVVKHIKQLGVGSFGTTYLVEYKGKQCAMKTINARTFDDANACVMEAVNMAKLEHPFLVQLIEPKLEQAKIGALKVHIFMEFCEGGDLSQKMKTQDSRMQPQEVFKAVGCVAAALSFMHFRNIFHRDVKPSNVLLTGEKPDVTYKLADFGLARLDQGGMSTRGAAGTPFYMSPDAFGSSCSKAVDVWALGRMAVVLGMWSAPTSMVSTPDQVEDLLRELPVEYAPQRDLLVSMLAFAPEDRPMVDNVAEQFVAALPQKTNPLSAHQSMMNESAVNLEVQLQRVQWLLPLRAEGLQWKSITSYVKECRFEPGKCTASEAAAFDHLTSIIQLSDSCRSFQQKYTCQELVLCRSRPREIGFLAKVFDLQKQYSTNPTLYDLSERLGGVHSELGAWRRMVLDHFQQYPDLLGDETGNTRVCIGFHAVPSLQVAGSILKGNFANLSKLDDGYIGSGIYLTFDLDYAFEEYGVNLYKMDEVPVIVCAVVIGNPFPVIECHACGYGSCPGAGDTNYYGKSIVASSGAHVAVMGKDPDCHSGCSDPLPIPPSRWDHSNKCTEICVNEDKVLPLAVMVLKKAQ